MLRALCERGIVPDLVVGSSIGAINAAFFAGQPTLEGTYLCAEMWRTVATHDVFPKGRLHGSWRFVERREAVYPIEGLRRLVRGYPAFRPAGGLRSYRSPSWSHVSTTAPKSG